MDSGLPIDYVYTHIEPTSETVVYIGSGSKHSAWEKGHRNFNHNKWVEKLIQEGYIPNDWIRVVDKNLTIEEAHDLEITMISSLKPRFNIQQTDRG